MHHGGHEDGSVTAQTEDALLVGSGCTENEVIDVDGVLVGFGLEALEETAAFARDLGHKSLLVVGLRAHLSDRLEVGVLDVFTSDVAVLFLVNVVESSAQLGGELLPSDLAITVLVEHQHLLVSELVCGGHLRDCRRREVREASIDLSKEAGGKKER